MVGWVGRGCQRCGSEKGPTHNGAKNWEMNQKVCISEEALLDFCDWVEFVLLKAVRLCEKFTGIEELSQGFVHRKILMAKR